MWLLVVLCTAGVALVWLPQFIGTAFDFSNEIGKKGKVSQSAFMESLKQIQNDFNTSLDERAQTENTRESTSAIKPLDETQLTNIAKELESFAKAADRPIRSLTQKAYCTRQGGIYEERSGANESLYGVCVFTDESECHALLFMRGKCHAGQFKSAEEGIPKWPDVEVSLSSMEYCKRINGILKTVPQNDARGVCINGLSVKNIGIASSKKATLTADDKKFTIPPLKPQQVFAVSSPIIIQKTPELSAIPIRITTTFQEIDKENNTYRYATEEKQTASH